MQSNTKKRTINQIIQATTQLLHEKPFTELTVQDICDASLVHRSTFYRYFDDKYLLLRHVIRVVSEEIFYSYAQKVEPNCTIFEEVIGFIDSHRSFFKHVMPIDNTADSFTEFSRICSETFYEISFGENFKSYDDPIYLKIKMSTQPKILCDFYSSGILQIITLWITGKYQISKDQLIHFANETFL